MTHSYLAISSLLCALFLTISGSTHAVVFSLQPSIQTIQQGIPGPAIPGQQPQQQEQQPPPPPPQQQLQQPQAPSQLSIPSSTPSTSSSTVIPQQQSQGVSEGIIVHGIIDSLIFTPSATWIATGNWTIGVNNGNAAIVTANMTWYNDNGTASHTHEIQNFRPFAAGQEQQQSIVVQPDSRSVSLKGTVDVGANHRITWNGVQGTIDIKKGGKILSIYLDDAQTNHHFGGRPIFGIVTSFSRCSDVPGPNMEILQPCLNIPIPPPAPQPTLAVSPSSSPAIANSVSPLSSVPLTTPANNTVQNQATSPSPPPQTLLSGPPSASNAPGSLTTIKPPSTAPSRVFNATGKSPFDILGGGG